MRVRLPVELTGVDLDATIVGDLAHVEVPGVGRVVLPAAAVTEVKAPLPEPPNLSVVTVDGEVYQRDDDPSWVKWWQAGSNVSTDWKAICAKGTPVLLVPAPEPVALPFEVVHRVEEDGIKLVSATSFVKVDPGCSRRVRFGFYNIIARAVEPSVARRIGDAFYAAANEATP